MQLKHNNRWNPYADDPVRIETAALVECSCDHFSDGGAVERARGTADNTARMLGRLLERLHERGLLDDDDDVVAVLGYGWEPFIPAED